MKTLIVGLGEVGCALAEVLACYSPEMIDKDDSVFADPFDVMHICFGYSEGFYGAVREYQKTYKPKYTVIHSTVPVGTSRTLGAIHSPVIGQHPNLTEGIRTFRKMLGGKEASAVADYFRRAGIKVCLHDAQETTEAAKLFLTESYRVNIEFAKRVKAYCDEHELNFHEVYTLAALNYNAGYAALGFPEFARPVLQPIDGAIGGHCVVPNKSLISQ
jgi:hypothetical protein